VAEISKQLNIVKAPPRLGHTWVSTPFIDRVAQKSHVGHGCVGQRLEFNPAGPQRGMHVASEQQTNSLATAIGKDPLFRHPS
jgi:hypothetical protein